MAFLKAAESSIHKQFAAALPGNVRMMFAYGSGVFKQIGHADTKENMLDYILAVDDPVQWHTENLQRNWKHYSFLKYGGAKFIADVQKGFGAGIYFNTLVPFEDRLVKYGVISAADLLEDLKYWKTLYVSGRLHKPVLLVEESSDDMLQTAVQKNLQSAVTTALLLLPDVFTAEKLFMTITALSYEGDFRMIVGEDKQKVRNIVVPHLDKFDDLYRPLISHSSMMHRVGDRYQQDMSPNSRLELLESLPKNIKERVIRDRLSWNRNRDVSVIMEDLSYSTDYSNLVAKACRETVRYSSIWQSAKGIFTAGLWKSVEYSGNKLRKMFRSSK